MHKRFSISKQQHGVKGLLLLLVFTCSDHVEERRGVFFGRISFLHYHL